jgi:WD40 repeat protein
MISGGEEGLIYLWDLTGVDQQPRRTFVGHSGQVHAVCFSSDGQTLASGGHDQVIRLWDVAGGQIIRPLRGHTDRVWSVCFSPDGQTLASGSDDGTVKFWDVQTGEWLSTRRPDRPYERLKISGVTGLTPAQLAALKELGAVDEQRPVELADQ